MRIYTLVKALLKVQLRVTKQSSGVYCVCIRSTTCAILKQ